MRSHRPVPEIREALHQIKKELNSSLKSISNNLMTSSTSILKWEELSSNIETRPDYIEEYTSISHPSEKPTSPISSFDRELNFSKETSNKLSACVESTFVALEEEIIPFCESTDSSINSSPPPEHWIVQQKNFNESSVGVHVLKVASEIIFVDSLLFDKHPRLDTSSINIHSQDEWSLHSGSADD